MPLAVWRQLPKRHGEAGEVIGSLGEVLVVEPRELSARTRPAGATRLRAVASIGDVDRVMLLGGPM
jgi:hypothetical protein